MSLLDSEGVPVAYDVDAPYGLSRTGGSSAAGILRHASALCALTAPSVVSYLRLEPHRWSSAWSNLGWRDREALVRICPLNEIAGKGLSDQLRSGSGHQISVIDHSGRVQHHLHDLERGPDQGVSGPSACAVWE